MTSLLYIGKPFGHIEGPDKVTGRARYAADITLPGMLWGKCLRSPYPHARIVAIEASRARQLPGVQAVIVGSELPAVLLGRAIRDMPVLAQGRVRFVGEKVVAVAAETLEGAEAALGLIEVEYEELPAVCDPLEAMREDAPRLHDDPGAYHGAVGSIPPIPNVQRYHVVRHGDVQAGLAQADRIFEHTFVIPNVHHGYIEPHACLIRVEADGSVEAWLSNKGAFRARDYLAAAIGLPEDRILIHLLPIGGDFGGKGSLMDAAVCFYLAQRSGRPVKMIMTYAEELMAGNPRHSAVVTLRTGVTNDGQVLARQGRLVFNSGAYGAFLPTVDLVLVGTKEACGCYHIPNVEVEYFRVYTNTVPCGHMIAPGQTQTVFAAESHMDMVAQEMGIDPLEFRLRNSLQEGDEPPLKGPLRDVRCKETLLAAARAANWGADKEPNVGRGIALSDKRPGNGRPSTIALSIDGDARVTVHTGIAEVGTGAQTVLQQIAAEELQVPLEAVSVAAIDTETSPDDFGSSASRVTHVAGRALLAAADELKSALVDCAARLWGLPPQQVRYVGGKLAADEGRNMTVVELMRRAAELGEAPLARTATYAAPGTPDVTSFCAQVAEVEVDPETGQVKLRNFVTAHDVGTVINPLTHQGQIEGNLVQGMGQALMEQLVIQDGAVTNLNLGDYKLPTMADIPELATVLLDESKTGPAPYQAKAMAEISIVAVPAAIANAVYDAVGVRLTELPIIADKVYVKLREKEGSR